MYIILLYFFIHLLGKPTQRTIWHTFCKYKYNKENFILNRIETPKPLSLECTKTENVERPAEVSTSEWAAGTDAWPALADAYAHARHKIDGEMPSSTDSRN